MAKRGKTIALSTAALSLVGLIAAGAAGSSRLLDHWYLRKLELARRDGDGNGIPNVSDAVHLLRYLFTAGGPPAAPFPECGSSPAGSSTTCEGFAPCE